MYDVFNSLQCYLLYRVQVLNKLLFKTSDMKLSENIIHGYYRLANYEIVVVLVVQRCLALCNSWTVAR